ncbi:MAG: hypothetical protein HY017_23990 [Betaproteobacteria bacterium]|nr:hypothetical protein [Betaproteobacteria bacterium]
MTDAIETLRQLNEARVSGTEIDLSFDGRLNLALTLHWVYRSARLGPDGKPAKSVLESSVAQYVSGVSAAASRLDVCIRHGRVTIQQIDTPPPEDWLQRIGLSEYEFYQHLLDTGTVIVHSALDRGLLFLNTVLALGLEPRLCNFDSVKKLIRDSLPQVLNAAANLRDLVALIASSRHYYIHRGESRTLDLFSGVRRVHAVTKAFSVPTEGVRIKDTEARWELLKTLRSETTAIETALRKLKESVREAFTSRLTDLGGFRPPTKLEIERFVKVTEYFQGGPIPTWMEQGDGLKESET